MPTLSEKFTRAYTTFSGIDITAIFDDKTVLTVSGVSCSITREKAPVYTFTSATPRSISRGKRGIAGSVVATLFDRHSMYELFLDPRKWYYAHRNEVNWLRNPTNASAPLRATGVLGQPTLQAGRTSATGRPLQNPGAGFTGDFFTLGQTIPGQASAAAPLAAGQLAQTNLLTDLTAAEAATFNQNTIAPAGQTIPPGAIVDGQAVTVRRSAVYADQILPWDLTLVAQNEYGQAAWSSINGCEFINEGYGVSVDDITSEQQFTFIAIHCEPWRALDPIGRELQNVGAQTSFGIDEIGNIAVDSDSGPINPDWAPFYSRDIDGRLRTTAGTVATPAESQAIQTNAAIPGFFPTTIQQLGGATTSATP